MAGRNPYEAFDNFRGPLQKAISCVNVSAHLWAFGSDGHSPGGDHAMVPDLSRPVDLAGERPLKFRCLFAYRVEEAEGERGPWKVTTVAYYHTLEDGTGREIVAYHWHPGTPPDFPHLHIGPGTGADIGGINKYHFPTGRVSLEGVLRLAIEEFGVTPARADWKTVLRSTEARYEAYRTWP